MRSLLVTGALGHIGSRLVRTLPATFPAARICLLDNLSTQRFASLFDLPREGRYQFVEADVCTVDWDPLLAGTDAVIHLAAITDAPASVGRGDEYRRVNLEATLRLAEACRKHGARLLFPSTTSVYGSQSALVDEDCPESDLKPQSPYASTKLDAERALTELSAQGLRCFIGRFGTIFGTSIGMRFHTAVNKFCWQAVMGQPLTVWKTALHQRRPYLDLEDAVRAIAFILERDVFDGAIRNVLTLNATVSDILETLKKVCPGLAVTPVDSPIMNQLSYTVSGARFEALGWRPRGNLERGIRDTCEMLRGARSAA